MQTKYLLIIPFIILASSSYSQQSGNSAYRQDYDTEYGKSDDIEQLFLTDSTFMIQASVGINVIADTYVATFGLAEESATIKECNEKIEKRIQGFISDLVKIGIVQTDIYVDMTTQNKIYDYKQSENLAEQYLKGFELKKNVIIKFKNIKDLDKMVISASSFQIYDLVKVDYHVIDINKIYTQLFQSTIEIINQKKGLYVSATNMKLRPISQIYGEQFYSYSPSQLYKSYKVSESEDVYTDYDSFSKKDLRKSPTFYYDKMNYSGLDKVINPIVTEPVVEFVLTLQIRYKAD